MEPNSSVHADTTIRALSEFAGPLFGPALNDYFFISEEFDGVASLRVHNAEEAAFPS